MAGTRAAAVGSSCKLLPDVDLSSPGVVDCKDALRSSTAHQMCDIEMTTNSKTSKTCRICGDIALGYNFGVISCESCKAFFRRTAVKSKISPCLFSGTCTMAVATRSFCPACRLSKCLSVGMMKDLILSKEAKKSRQDKILSNKKQKQENQMQRHHGAATSKPEVPAATGAPVVTESAAGTEAPTETASQCSLHWPASMNPAPRHIGSAASEANPQVAVNASCSWQLCLQVPKCGPSRVSPLLLERLQKLLASSSLRVQRLLQAGSWAELLALGNTYTVTLGTDPSADAVLPANQVFDMDLFAARTSGVIRQFVKFAKELPEFTSMSQRVQIRLLKAGAVTCILLRSAELLDLQSGCWSNGQEALPLDVLKEVGGSAMPEFFEEHAAIAGSIKQLVPVDAHGRCDSTIFALLHCIMLLSPENGVEGTGVDEPSGLAVISDAQQRYVAMLRRHLEATYSYAFGADLLPNLLQLLSVCKHYSQRQVSGFLSCKSVENDPLLREVLRS